MRKLQRQEEMRRVREEIERQQEEENIRKEQEQGTPRIIFYQNEINCILYF